MKVVDLVEKFSLFESHWAPKVVAGYNGNNIMVVKVQGAFPFHDHRDSDDFFLVIEGEVIPDVGAESHPRRPGEIVVVPKGVRHRPRAERGAKVLLIELRGTPNTGDPATAAVKERI